MLCWHAGQPRCLCWRAGQQTAVRAGLDAQRRAAVRVRLDPVVVPRPESAVAQEGKQEAKDGHEESETHEQCEHVPAAADIHVALPAGSICRTASSSSNTWWRRKGQHRRGACCMSLQICGPQRLGSLSSNCAWWQPADCCCSALRGCCCARAHTDSSPVGGVQVLVHVIDLVFLLLFKRVLHQLCMHQAAAQDTQTGNTSLTSEVCGTVTVAGRHSFDLLCQSPCKLTTPCKLPAGTRTARAGVLVLLQGCSALCRLPPRQQQPTLTQLLSQRLAAQLGRVELELLWVGGVEAAAPDGEHLLVTIGVMLAVRTHRHDQPCVRGGEGQDSRQLRPCPAAKLTLGFGAVMRQAQSNRLHA